MPSFVTNAPATPSGRDHRSQNHSFPSKANFQRRSQLTSLSLCAIATFSITALSAFSPTIARQAVAQSLPTLSAGDTSDRVSQLQATLTLLGFYTGEISGIYDQNTVDAVIRFQTAAGIAADGVAGPSTWQKLLPTPSDVTNAAAPAPAATPVAVVQPAPSQPPAAEPITSGPPVLRLEAEGPAVSQLQRELQTLGYYQGPIDGGFGEQTQGAVEAFQLDKGLFVDGVVGGATWDALTVALEGL